MYQIKTIGTIRTKENETWICVDSRYRKALRYLSEFSHMHVFYVSANNELRRVVAEVTEVDMGKGQVRSSSLVPEKEEMKLVDIKPYFPSEDTVKSPVPGEADNCQGIPLEPVDEELYEVDTWGEIRNVGGKVYIQCADVPATVGRYITVYWWFHRFDDARYRRTTECDPPYEEAPRSGIFATRSPVRPNPIAMTVARVVKVDQDRGRIYLSGIESFDRTPCLGFCDYDATAHRIEGARVPTWLAHWPKYLDEKEEQKSSETRLQESSLKRRLGGKPYVSLAQRSKVHPDTDVRESKEILVYGARENNLKGLNVRIPYGKITAVVGVSGSGKSSLVNNTIYAECRRRMEYLSHSHNILQSPKVDEMIGCIPAVVINQNPIRGNSLSTVGTYTDSYGYLRNIYASVALRHCPDCGNEIIPLTREQIRSLMENEPNRRIYTLSGEEITGESLEHMVDQALQAGEGAFYAEFEDGERVLLQTKQKCYHCDKLMFQLTPSTFSYMDPDYRCPVCAGMGEVAVVDEGKVIEHPERSLLEGASSFYGKLKSFRDNPNANWMKGQVFGLAEAMQVDLEKPWDELPMEFREAVLHGSEQEVTFTYHNKKNGRKGEIKRSVEGLFSILERANEENTTSTIRERYMTRTQCPDCHGERLGREGRMATIENVRYPEAARMTFYEMKEFCQRIQSQLNEAEYAKTEYAFHALMELCETAIQLGIGYLHLNQQTSTLSGGEGQRIKLLGAFKNHISGILYIFDEPSKGLHPKDYEKIAYLLQALVKEGNTIIMVEHNADMIRLADNIIEIGPGAGEKGGTLVGEGTLTAMLQHKGTQIGRYMGQEDGFTLSKKRELSEPLERIHMSRLNYNNLKDVSVEWPKQALTCVWYQRKRQIILGKR